MLNCKQATHLLSQAQDRKLNWSEKLALEMHLALCQGCSNFKKQLSLLQQACRRYVGNCRDKDD